MVYNKTEPANPVYVDYNNPRNLLAYGGDNGSEEIINIGATNSSTGIHSKRSLINNEQQNIRITKQ